MEFKIKRLSKDIRKAHAQFYKYESGFENFSEYLYCRFDSLSDCEKHFGITMNNFHDWHF